MKQTYVTALRLLHPDSIDQDKDLTTEERLLAACLHERLLEAHAIFASEGSLRNLR